MNKDLLINVKHGNLPMIKTLISSNVNINTCNDLALRIACEHNNIEIVKFLLENNSNVNAYNGSPLKLAVQNGNIEIIQLLVDHRADISIDDYGAIITAAYYGHIQILRYFLKMLTSLTVRNISPHYYLFTETIQNEFDDYFNRPTSSIKRANRD